MQEALRMLGYKCAKQGQGDEDMYVCAPMDFPTFLTVCRRHEIREDWVKERAAGAAKDFSNGDGAIGEAELKKFIRAVSISKASAEMVAALENAPEEEKAAFEESLDEYKKQILTSLGHSLGEDPDDFAKSCFTGGKKIAFEDVIRAIDIMT